MIRKSKLPFWQRHISYLSKLMKFQVLHFFDLFLGKCSERVNMEDIVGVGGILHWLTFVEKEPSLLKRKAHPEDATGVGASSEVNLSIDQKEPWTVFAHKKPQKGWKVYNPRTMRPPPLSADTKSVKLMSWNVNGLRALLKLEGFSALQLAQREDFDVLCLQETKLQASFHFPFPKFSLFSASSIYL